MREMDQAHQEELRKRNEQYANEIEKLMAEMKRLVAEKEAAIKEITINMESARSNYEIRINELELTLQKYQQMTIRLEATVLELNTRLGTKDDVEQQLGTWKAHHDTIEMSKAEL